MISHLNFFLSRQIEPGFKPQLCKLTLVSLDELNIESIRGYA